MTSVSHNINRTDERTETGTPVQFPCPALYFPAIRPGGDEEFITIKKAIQRKEVQRYGGEWRMLQSHAQINISPQKRS